MTTKHDRHWLVGLIFLFISLLVFCTPLHFILGDSASGLFTVNYVLAIIYFLVLIISGRLKRGQKGLAPLFVFLLLCLVSCYALNRSIGIFQPAVPWWCVVLVIGSINYLTIPFYFNLPRWAQYLVCTIAGISLTGFLYLSICLIPVYVIGAIGVIALGLGLHTFVPLLFVIYTIVLFYKVARDNRRNLFAAFGGIAIAILVVIQFNLRWKAEITRVENDLDRTEDSHVNHLPHWVAVAQDCRPTAFNEHFLKTELVYETAGTWDWELFDIRSHRQFNEQSKHDPLIMIATFFYGASRLDLQDRIKVLESIFDSRHAAQERIWRDDALTTTNVKTNVELWPRLHISYTELELTVANNTLNPTWFDKGEALYTFHLPEGAAVTSLSLWINGHEVKGVFASRHKADTAYRSIVGYEQRDPSVVHWQEGNNVIVRIFPVLPHEPRRFRIGITAPLEKKDDRLLYHNTWFDGPDATRALSSVHIEPVQALTSTDPLPELKNGNFRPDWSISIQDPGIEPETFRFNGHDYTTGTATPVYGPADIRTVYLDLNKSWSKDEFTALLGTLKGKKIYAWQPAGGLVEITPNSGDLIFRQCQYLQFSLFPLPVIRHKEHSLLISKSPPSSPSLSDLNNSDFSTELHSWLNTPGKLRLFNIGEELSPYLKTLKECGAFSWETGNYQALRRHITENRFLLDPDQPDVYRIDPAGLLIRSSSSDSLAPTTRAPDHLLRLFAYRRIQQTLKGHLPGDYTDEDEPAADSLVQTAQEAGIVSPVSSLVVLENPDDYKRFDITQSLTSLKDASLHAKGAVPEPGQWALLAAVLIILLVIRLRKTMAHDR